MSDTKWRKMFTALDDAEVDVRQMIVKFVGVEELRIMRFPSKGALHPPLPYFDCEFGPTELRAIEWLEIPAVARWPRPNNVPALEVAQDIEAVCSTLAALGHYPVEATPGGVRIVGYSS